MSQQEQEREDIINDIEARKESFYKMADLLQEKLSPQEEYLLDRMCVKFEDIVSQYKYLLAIDSTK